MSNLLQVIGSIKTDARRRLPKGEYTKSYGTGGYFGMLDDDTGIEYCYTTQGDEFSVYHSDHADTTSVVVFRGDAERIKALVKAETDHFDCNLTWA